MKITVRLYALARQLAARDCVELQLGDGATVQQVRCRLGETVPALRGLLPQMLIAVDSEYAGDDTPVTEGTDVACIPPVSGGGVPRRFISRSRNGHD